MTRRVPGFERVEPILTQDGRLLLGFKDQAFDAPFVDRYVSDGTIKMFAYLVLLFDPAPHPLLTAEIREDGTMDLLASSRTALARDVVVDGNHAFVADGLRGLLVYDVSDPAEPSLVGKEWLLGGGWSIAKRGDSVYLASGIYGIQVVDVSEPTAPVWVDNLFACDVVDGVEVGGNVLVAASTWVDWETVSSWTWSPGG